jgi:single stranded DNA-binding protein
MLNLNRITLIGNTGKDAKTVPNGPTTLSLATNVYWNDKDGNPQTRTEWHLLVIWNALGHYAAKLPKGSPLYVEGELIYEKYPRKVEAAIGKKVVQVEVMVTVAKIKVTRLISLVPVADAPGEDNDEGDAQQAQGVAS